MLLPSDEWSCHKSDEEFHRTYLTYTPDGGKQHLQEDVSSHVIGTTQNLPLFMDWKRAGAVTEVKEQVYTYITVIRIIMMCLSFHSHWPVLNIIL